MDFATIRKNLEKRRFTVSCFETKDEASDYLVGAIRNETLGFGGSITLTDMGLYEKLGKNNKVIWHWITPSDRGRFPEFTAYITSVNGAAETGELVNIDGSGNRVSACCFGPKKLYFVVGANKIRPDLASAIDRARNIASPLNAKRMNAATPCVKDLRCHDCSSPARMCGALVVHMSPMFNVEHCEVVLINEDLGY